MFLLYDLIFFICSIIYLPRYLFKRKFHRGFSSRLGFLPKGLQLHNPIWIHAVSVGEAMAVRNLLGKLRSEFPDKRFVISTVTATGNKIAKAIACEGDFVTYLPLDFSFIVESAVNKIRPSLFIIVETEIWPNLISCLQRRNVPIALVNGRISDRSFKGYLSIRPLLKKILRKVNIFCVQTERDAWRFGRLGVAQEKIHITGNLKFDVTDGTDKRSTDYPAHIMIEAGSRLDLENGRGTDVRLILGLREDEKLFVAGSTHPGEEAIILSAYKNLLKEFPQLRLLIAPRHPERAAEVESVIKKAGFYALRISNLTDTTRKRENEITSKRKNGQAVFILDTIGQLLSFYGIADIVFVGGSLVKKGGHNILEPASLGRPVLFGPYMFNFRDIADLFLKYQGACLVPSGIELHKTITDLLAHPEQSKRMVQNAWQLLKQEQGVTERTLQCLRGLIKDVYS